jgi:hypothetical protein
MSIFLSSRLRKTIAWLALCAMCFGAAAPTVSRWLVQAARAQNLIAICDQHGITLVAPSQLAALQTQPQDPHHKDNPSDDHGDACGYCTLIKHWPFAPTVAAVFAPPAPPQAAHCVDAPIAAPALRPWHRSQMQQAPPVLA